MRNQHLNFVHSKLLKETKTTNTSKHNELIVKLEHCYVNLTIIFNQISLVYVTFNNPLPFHCIALPCLTHCIVKYNCTVYLLIHWIFSYISKQFYVICPHVFLVHIYFDTNFGWKIQCRKVAIAFYHFVSNSI